jgi:hypothetical protein
LEELILLARAHQGGVCLLQPLVVVGRRSEDDTIEVEAGAQRAERREVFPPQSTDREAVGDDGRHLVHVRAAYAGAADRDRPLARLHQSAHRRPLFGASRGVVEIGERFSTHVREHEADEVADQRLAVTAEQQAGADQLTEAGLRLVGAAARRRTHGRSDLRIGRLAEAAHARDGEGPHRERVRQREDVPRPELVQTRGGAEHVPLLQGREPTEPLEVGDRIGAERPGAEHRHQILGPTIGIDAGGVGLARVVDGNRLVAAWWGPEQPALIRRRQGVERLAGLAGRERAVLRGP